MKAFGLNHWLGLPVRTEPVNEGFKETRSGFLISPSPERFEPTRGVKGKPDKNVPIPFNCHPEMSLFSSAPMSPSQCWPWPNGRSYCAEMLDWLVAFKADGPQS